MSGIGQCGFCLEVRTSVRCTRKEKYTVKKGDNPTKIAREHGISEKKYIDELIKENGIKDPARLQIGQILTVNVPEACQKTGPKEEKGALQKTGEVILEIAEKGLSFVGGRFLLRRAIGSRRTSYPQLFRRPTLMPLREFGSFPKFRVTFVPMTTIPKLVDRLPGRVMSFDGETKEITH